MKKFSRWVVRYRVLIVIVSIVLMIPSYLMYIHTKVNYDMAEVKAKLTASGLSASQADQYASTLIYMAAAEAAKTGASISTEADLEAALKTQGANLLNAQSVQGKAAAAAAAAKQGCADQTVAAMLAGVRAGSAGTVYQSTVSQVEDTLDKMGLDKSLAPVVIAYACQAVLP